MVEVKNRYTGEVYKGHNASSIVRRVWGRRAELHGYTKMAGETRYMADVILPPTEAERRKDSERASSVLANVIVDPDA